MGVKKNGEAGCFGADFSGQKLGTEVTTAIGGGSGLGAGWDEEIWGGEGGWRSWKGWRGRRRRG